MFREFHVDLVFSVRHLRAQGVAAVPGHVVQYVVIQRSPGDRSAGVSARAGIPAHQGVAVMAGPHLERFHKLVLGVRDPDGAGVFGREITIVGNGAHAEIQRSLAVAPIRASAFLLVHKRHLPQRQDQGQPCRHSYQDVLHRCSSVDLSRWPQLGP